MTPEPLSGFALSSPFLRNKTGGRRWIADAFMTPSGAHRHAHVAQGLFFHPKDAMGHNRDISGAWTTFVLDKSEGSERRVWSVLMTRSAICLGYPGSAIPDEVQYSKDRDGI